MIEFEEMQKIWNEQNGEAMYAINESAVHNHISRKKKAASRRISIVEINLIVINSITTIILFADAIMDQEGLWDYAGAGIMGLTILFLILFRSRRKKKELIFDRTMMGELDHAIASSTSMVHIATIMIYYYLLPLAVFILLKMFFVGASPEKWALIIGMFLVSFLLVYWERKAFHIPRKEQLIKLKRKLMEE